MARTWAGAAISGFSASNSIRRSVAPAAFCTSPQDSATAAIEEAAKIARNTNCASAPPLMSPAATARAPAHNTKAMPPKPRLIATAVIWARARMRKRLAEKAASIASRKRRRAWLSRPKACTVSIASRFSAASAAASATRSCAAVVSLRTPRPKAKIGTSMIGISTNSHRVSFSDVAASKINAPVSVTSERMAKDAVAPTKFSINKVSVVSRDNASPVRNRAKNAGDSPIMWS